MSYRPLIAFLLILVLAAPAAPSVQAQAAPEPVVSYQAWYEIDDPPRVPYTVIQSIVEFEPGAVADTHRHGGPAFVLLLEGELALIEDGVEQTVAAGEQVIESVGRAYRAENRTEHLVRLLATYIVPVGEAVTTVVDGGGQFDLTPPGPNVPLTGDVRLNEGPARFSVVHLVMDFEPGSWTAPQSPQGDTFVLVTAGEITRSGQAGERTIGEGESWLEPANSRTALGNASDVPAQTVMTVILPR